MIRRLILIVVCAAFPVSAVAGPKEDAQALFDKFLTAFSAADVDSVVGLFAPDAQVWVRGCATSRRRRSRFASISLPI